MRIQRLDPDNFSRAYEVLCQGVHPWQGVADTPFSVTWCVIEPGGAARAHKHQEHEAFLIAAGRGRMRVDDETTEVGPGDAIFMEPWNVHELANVGDESLLFLDLCWEELAQAIETNDEAPAEAEPERPAHTLCTTAPPTPNGDFHGGHLSGPYMRADFHTRYLKMRGVDARHAIWMDDHQSYVVTKARKLGLEPQEVADKFADLMEDTMRLARIEMDLVLRLKDVPRYSELVCEVFRRLYDKGALEARDAPTLYCETCESFLFEAHVSGLCPHCGEGTDGNACESCGRPNDCVDLGNPRCNKCGSQPAVKTLRRIYFPLAPYADQLRDYTERVRMPPRLRALAETMLADGLPDIPVSFAVDLGIPVPVEGFEDQRIYVWFEMAPGYLATARELLAPQAGVDWQSFWGSPERSIVQFFGFDNGYFHCVLHPAILLACEADIELAAAFPCNEFMLYEGSKFSTSREHAIWGQELFARVPADVARYYLAYDGPETEQTDFVLAQLEEITRRELYGHWEPWLRGLGAKVRDHCEGSLPGTGAWTPEHRDFFRTLNRISSEAAAAYETASFSPRRATRLMSELVHTARRFGKAEESWRDVPRRFEEWRTALALEAMAARMLAQISAPVMPDFAQALYQDLGYEGSIFNGSWEEPVGFVPSGRDLSALDRAHFDPAFAGG